MNEFSGLVDSRRGVGLGDLERDVMEVLWTNPGSSLTVRDVGSYFPDHAYTTILTVLTRLHTKGFVKETKQGRLNTFAPTASREDYITGLIQEALAHTDDRPAALAHFAESLAPSDRNVFRRIFSRKTTR